MLQSYIQNLIFTKKIKDHWLLNEEERQISQEWLEENDTYKKLSRKIRLGQFSVIKDDTGNLFAIYNPTNTGYAHGMSAIIKIAQNIKTGEYCLVKIQKLIKTSKNPDMPQKNVREKNQIDKCQYLYGYQEREKRGKYEFKSYIFMKELPGLTGDRFINLFGPSLSQCELLTVIKHLLEALNQIHSEGIIHRDLHSENILIDKYDNFKVYIIDWGTVLDQDKDGYAYDYGLQDKLKEKGRYRFANGFDFFVIFPFFNEALEYVVDSEIKDSFDALKREVGSRDEGYENINLKPLIEKVDVLLSGLDNGISGSLHL